MAKKVVHLKESDLKRIVSESVKRLVSQKRQRKNINEAYFAKDDNIRMLDRSEQYDYWEKAKELMGAEQMLDEIQTMLDVDTVNWILENLDTDYELGLFDDLGKDDEDEEYDDDEEIEFDEYSENI